MGAFPVILLLVGAHHRTTRQQHTESAKQKMGQREATETCLDEVVQGEHVRLLGPEIESRGELFDDLGDL